MSNDCNNLLANTKVVKKCFYSLFIKKFVFFINAIDIFVIMSYNKMQALIF